MSKKKMLKPRIDTKDGPSHYIEEDLKKMMTKKEFEQFGKWMYGQTGLVRRDGKCGYYSWDVERFLKLVRKGIPTYFD